MKILKIEALLETQIGCAICAHTFLCHDNIVTSELGSFKNLREEIGSGIKSDENHIRLSNRPGIGIKVNDNDIMKHLISEKNSITSKQIRKGFIA